LRRNAAFPTIRSHFAKIVWLVFLGNTHVPHPSHLAIARTLAVWAMFLGTLGLSGGCAPLRLNQNDEAMRQLDELPPAIKIETSTPVGMTNREMQSRQQERAELRRDAPQEPTQRRRGGPESQAPRYQPSEQTKVSPPPVREEETATPMAQRAQISAATEMEYLRVLDQANITDPIERAQFLADLEASEPRHRGMLLRMIKANASQRQPKATEPRSGPLKRGMMPEDAVVDADEEPLPRRRDHLAMAVNNPHDDLPIRKNPRAEQPLARTLPEPIAKNSTPAVANPIRQVAHLEPEPTREVPAAQEPEQLFRDALSGMEKQLKNGTADRTTEIAAIRLRLLQALAGQREAALAPVPNLSPAQQEFLSQQVYALAALVDQQGNALWSRRAGLTAEHLQSAADKLSQQAGLQVRNAQLCTEIKSFGNYTTFAKQTFRPNQEVLLYAELDRFQTRNTERGFHTKFHASYQILDRNGRKIVEKELGLAEEHSPVRRRDYFVSYLVRLPAELQGDEYTLKLMIEDQLGGQVGETSVRLMIEGAAATASPLLLPMKASP
jgi:hypothetical protein